LFAAHRTKSREVVFYTLHVSLTPSNKLPKSFASIPSLLAGSLPEIKIGDPILSQNHIALQARVFHGRLYAGSLPSPDQGFDSHPASHAPISVEVKQPNSKVHSKVCF
jgi:hypothetical protein